MCNRYLCHSVVESNFLWRDELHTLVCCKSLPLFFTLFPPKFQNLEVLLCFCHCPGPLMPDGVGFVIQCCRQLGTTDTATVSEIGVILFLLLWLLLFLSVAGEFSCCVVVYFPLIQAQWALAQSTSVLRWFLWSAHHQEKHRLWCWNHAVNLRCHFTAWSEPWPGHSS